MLRLMMTITVMTALGGCATGWPYGGGADPNAAQAVQDSEKLVAECRQHFVEDLGQTPVTWDSGPGVARAGAVTTVQLEAQPTDPHVIDPVRYSCVFEDGKLGTFGTIR